MCTGLRFEMSYVGGLKNFFEKSFKSLKATHFSGGRGGLLNQSKVLWESKIIYDCKPHLLQVNLQS